MAMLATLSTFRPPPFVSSERFPDYALPTLLVGTVHGDNVSFKVVPSAPAVHLVTGRDQSTDLNVNSWLWNQTDISVTTQNGFGVDGLSTSGPTYPAGYPSGYTWAHIACASVVVTVIMLIIVFGNFLVMWAIVTDRNLKGTQNFYIGSLAMADFLLGLLIVPFSLANELMGYWYFGTALCEVWKAIDVLLCTASIASLCLISLDRYWSITKAVHYPRQRTPKRAAIMIFIVWFVSAAICIPPLIGWKQPAPDSDWPICALSEDIGYVLYSSMGSFYIPAFIMVFVYFKIYQAAKARARKNVSKGPKSGMSEKSEQKNSTESSGTEQHCPQQQLQQPPSRQHLDHLRDDLSLRASSYEALGASTAECLYTLQTESVTGQETPTQTISAAAADDDEGMARSGATDFRSRSYSLPCRGDERTRLIFTDSDSCDALGGRALNMMDRKFFGFHSMPTTTTTDTDSSVDVSNIQQKPPLQLQQQQHQLQCDLTKQLSSAPSAPAIFHAVSPPQTGSPGQGNGAVQQFKIMEPKLNGSVEQGEAREQRTGLLGSLRRHLFQHGATPANTKADPKNRQNQQKKKGHHHKRNGHEANTGAKSVDFFSAERQKRKLAKARERRATLVLGLVMAAFILCWLPFFLLYLASAFCNACIPGMVFKVFFWIGYCNSALNPIIYTVFNRDFRRAFHRILCGKKRGRR